MLLFLLTATGCLCSMIAQHIPRKPCAHQARVLCQRDVQRLASFTGPAEEQQDRMYRSLGYRQAQVLVEPPLPPCSKQSADSAVIMPDSETKKDAADSNPCLAAAALKADPLTASLAALSSQLQEAASLVAGDLRSVQTAYAQQLTPGCAGDGKKRPPRENPAVTFANISKCPTGKYVCPTSSSLKLGGAKCKLAAMPVKRAAAFVQVVSFPAQ